VINAVSTEVATTDHPVIYKTEQPQRTADEWAQIINNAWQKSVETILETGCRIIEAKDDLEHGAFEQMVQTKLSFGPSTARKLMTIARHPVLSNRSHVNVLPASWGTLYALATKLPAELLEAKIADGTITQRSSARTLPCSGMARRRMASRDRNRLMRRSRRRRSPATPS
jgi:hypothetical protein